MKELSGRLDGKGKSFAIVASRFNDFVVKALIDGARSTLVRLGADEDAITLVRVPGAFEIASAATRLCQSSKYDAVICLGAVIRGETPHFDYVAGESAREIARLASRSSVPVINGVLTTNTVDQAIERAGTKAGNKGADAALAAVEMANLFEQLE